MTNANALLGMVCGWTTLFATCLGLSTKASPVDLFTATAAYAAVLVVFVSGNLVGTSGSFNDITIVNSTNVGIGGLSSDSVLGAGSNDTIVGV